MDYLKYIVSMGVLIAVSVVYEKFKLYSEQDQQIRNYEIVKKYLVSESSLAKSKLPILWIHNDYNVNARNWPSFFSRNTLDLNQPYVLLTIKSIIDNKEYFSLAHKLGVPEKGLINLKEQLFGLEANFETFQAIDFKGGKRTRKSKKGRKYKIKQQKGGVSGLFQAVGHDFNSAYRAWNGEPAPANPLPYEDQIHFGNRMPDNLAYLKTKIHGE